MQGLSLLKPQKKIVTPCWVLKKEWLVINTQMSLATKFLGLPWKAGLQWNNGEKWLVNKAMPFIDPSPRFCELYVFESVNIFHIYS